ncbi:MAG: anti-sigma regulatory factor [Firmicutes bacterium]|jgi:serine/threonine-protein kinase RsbT|nr:anti-sigma regulatory factor [Bacillota bacterium]
MLECKSSIENELDIIAARRCAKEVAKELGFSTVDQVRIATAISELARNVVLYAKEGSIIVRALCEGERKGLEISVADNGPGIPNVELAMTDGYSTSGGLGAGLPGARRLMDTFRVDSQLGQGTTILARKWKA